MRFIEAYLPCASPTVTCWFWVATCPVAYWYLIGYHMAMNAAVIVRAARTRAGLSLRALADRAATSHSTLAFYESGRKVPTVETLDRIVRSAGYDLDVAMTPRVGNGDATARGRELIEALELAAMFPARHAPALEYPRFRRQ